MILWMSTALGGTFVFDFENNVISGDVYPGPALTTLGTRAPALNACLAGVDRLFDASGGTASAEIRITPGGTVEALSFWGDDFAEVNACLTKAVDGLVLPAGRPRMGLVRVERSDSPPVSSGAVHHSELDGLKLALTAVPRDGVGPIGIAVTAQITPQGPVGLGEEALTVVSSIHRPDGTGSGTASWSIGDQNPAPCIEAGQTATRKAQSHDAVSAGEVLRARIYLTHGTCSDAMATRTVVGAVQLVVSAAGEPTVTLWRPSDLYATQPFAD